MPQNSPTVHKARRRLRGGQYATALSLTMVAGFVDVFAYLSLYHVFVANMSGNSIDVGMRLAEHQWIQVLNRALPVAAFVAGLLACSLVVELAQRHSMRRVLALTLTIEALCLVGFLVFGINVFGNHSHPVSQPRAAAAGLVALAAFAMGIQNASLRAARVLNVYTTHVTGTLTRMSQRIAQFIFWLHDHPHRSERALKHPTIRQAGHLGSLWLGYVVGAAMAGWAWMDAGVIALVGPIAIIALIAAMAALWPESSR